MRAMLDRNGGVHRVRVGSTGHLSWRRLRPADGPCRLILGLVLGALILPLTRISADSSGNSNAPNTIVRFQIQRGATALGVVDVELFDSDKPETVGNFLLYVRSGAYSNSFLHRCVPGFVVQGGGFSVADPRSTNRFSTFEELPNYGRLTNEYFVGPQQGNTFGTLAMAKVGGDPNSATSQWFFNLANNPNLDAQNGGFTVFGRVLASTNLAEGTNVLRHFNTLSTNAGVVNLANLLGSAYSVFSDLPVAYTNTISRAPLYQELYYTQISIVNQTNLPGQSPPTISLVSPPPNSRFTNQTVTVRGTASDDTGVARVIYRLQGSPSEIAAGTTNWEVALTPPPGVNTITVESIDLDGNRSTNAPAAVTFLFVREVPLNLQVIGAGSVAGATNGQVLQAGRYYTLTATPASGYVFDTWTGSVAATTPSITFQVPASATNFDLTANFMPDPLPQLTGSYHGLFRATNAVALENAGYLALTLQSDGSFGGTILHRGGAYTYTGRFDSTGSALIQGEVGGINRSISLLLQKTNAAGLITGGFVGGAVEVRLERLTSALPGSNAPPVGRYTFALPNGTPSPSQLVPGGNGFGTGTLDSSGALQLAGTLGDGTVFTAAPPMTRAGHWPLYVSLFAGRGALLGWLSPTNDPGNGSLDGSLQWIKSLDLSAATYPAGFSNQVAFLGSPYKPPASGTRVLNWVHGLAAVTGTDLGLGITNLVKLATNNVFQVEDANESGLQLSIDPNSGLVAGSFTHPWEGTTNALRGVVLGRSETILGQFVAGDQTGALNLSAAPFLVPQSIVDLTAPALSAALADGGLLRFETEGVITLTNPLTVPYDTALDANGHTVVLSGGGVTRLLEVQSNVNFSARGITFAHGRHTGTTGTNGTPAQSGGDGCGAGILNLGGIVGLTNCVLTNFTALGGAAGVDATTTATPAVGGRGLGAAICNRGGQVAMQDCLLADNSAIGGPGASGGAAMGAALFSDGGECDVQGCVFLRNRVDGGDARLVAPGEYGRAGDAAGGALAVISGGLRLFGAQCLTNSAFGAGVLTNNAGSGHGSGGALFVESNAEVVVEQTIFAANTASGGESGQTQSAGVGRGGAAFNAGSLSVRNTTFEQNTALGGLSQPPGPGLGGALASLGTLTVETSTLNDNRARGGSYQGTNSVPGAEAAGGAIHALGGTLALTNSTFAFNRALGGSGTQGPASPIAAPGDALGGALAVVSNSAVLVNVTLALNEAIPGPLGDASTGTGVGGAIANLGGTAALWNSILSSNAPANFFGPISDNGYNLSSDASFALTATGSSTNTDSLLGPLTDNGGPTRTMAISANSPARDVVPASFPPVDQRGIIAPAGLAGGRRRVRVRADAAGDCPSANGNQFRSSGKYHRVSGPGERAGPDQLFLDQGWRASVRGDERHVIVDEYPGSERGRLRCGRYE